MQSVLVIDIGNSAIKLGYFERETLSRDWRIEGLIGEPIQLITELQRAVASIPALEAFVFSNVRAEVTTHLQQWQNYADSKQLCFFNCQAEGIRRPVDFSKYASGELGADRLVNVCGAAELYPGSNVIIFDFGTATTLDLLSKDRVYRGGAILPGLETFARSLQQTAPHLPKVNISRLSYLDKGTLTCSQDIRSPQAMGLNTASSLAWGIQSGYRGAITELLKEAQQCFVQPAKVIATGGLAPVVIQACQLAETLTLTCPGLTLSGLYKLYVLNQ